MSSVTREVVVNAPVAQVFAFWKNFENFPRFMENIESIHVTGPDETHWKAKGPLGKHVEWDAKVISVQENCKVAWQSTGGDIETHGAVTFEEAATNQTRVTVGMEYRPPAGVLGEAVAKLLHNPEAQLDADLQRFKQVAETDGFAAASGGTGAAGAGSYVSTVHTSQRGDVGGTVTGSGSGANQHSATRSTA